MKKKILTILVPTYNRASRLILLLDCLARSCSGLEEKVQIIVSDNASNDDTPSVCEKFQSQMPSAVVIRHENNVGAEENFCFCIEQAQSHFFWLIGDDDLPLPGVIEQTIEVLTIENPDLLYLKSRCVLNINNSEVGNTNQNYQPKVLSREKFTIKANIWLTFISGMVVNLDTYRRIAGHQSLRNHLGTSLVQLEWVLRLLSDADKFMYVPHACLLATGANSGNYKILEVFAKNFPLIVTKALHAHPRLIEILLRACIENKLPSLVYGLRNGSVGDFQKESISGVAHPTVKTFWAYRFWLLPIASWPIFWARIVYVINRLFYKSKYSLLQRLA
jgi:abequosyltransferase